MRTPEQVQEILRCLAQAYPADCSLQYQKDYELLFAVRLAAQCTDERVNQVTPALYARFPTLEAFAAAEPEDVEPYVHSCGFYRAKARDIVLCARMSDPRKPYSFRTDRTFRFLHVSKVVGLPDRRP